MGVRLANMQLSPGDSTQASAKGLCCDVFKFGRLGRGADRSLYKLPVFGFRGRASIESKKRIAESSGERVVRRALSVNRSKASAQRLNNRFKRQGRE
jgi:hypothetical protein